MVFRPNMNLSQTILLFENHFVERRAKAIQRYVTHVAADALLKGTVSRIPMAPAYKTYRDALRLVQGGLPSEPIFAVVGEVAKSEIIEKATDIIYFKPRKKIGKMDKALSVLIQFQPWTQDTLPFTPTSDKATLMKRTVSKQDVIAIAKAREDDRPKWTSLLSEAGVQVKRQEAKIPSAASALPDILYTAMRLEFGLGGAQAVAHWRPAYREAQELVKRVFFKPSMSEALLNWKDDQWMKWRDLSAERVPAKMIDDLADFQTRVAMR